MSKFVDKGWILLASPPSPSFPPSLQSCSQVCIYPALTCPHIGWTIQYELLIIMVPQTVAWVLHRPKPRERRKAAPRAVGERQAAPRAASDIHLHLARAHARESSQKGSTLTNAACTVLSDRSDKPCEQNCSVVSLPAVKQDGRHVETLSSRGWRTTASAALFRLRSVGVFLAGVRLVWF